MNNRWSTDYSKDLYLYGESNGVIWDVAVNRSNAAFNTMYVVGAFDTVSEASQIQYCSVGQWDGPGGVGFEKVKSITFATALHIVRFCKYRHEQSYYFIWRLSKRSRLHYL